MTDTSVNPNYLVESRYWVLNARLAEPVPSQERLAEIVSRFTGEKMSGQDMVAGIIRHPLDNYSEVTSLLSLRLEEGLVKRLEAQYCHSRSGLHLTGVSFCLSDLEILCCYAVFSVDPSIDIRTLEEEGMGLVDLVSSLQPDLEKLFRLLEENRLVIFQPEMIFGVPGPLRRASLHNPDNSYLYNWHVFFPGNRPMLEKTVEAYGMAGAAFSFDGGTVYPGWGLVLWDVPGITPTPEELVNRIFIDSLSGSESVMYDNSIFCFTGFLDLIIRNEKVDSLQIRQVCNISHLALQRIKLWKRNLSVEQQVYLEKGRAVMMLEQKKADFDTSEETLIRAAEGLEVKHSQKSGRVIELVLSFFTALSLYSVANDFYSIMITQGTVQPMNIFSVRTLLIFLATAVVLGFLFLVRKARKD